MTGEGERERERERERTGKRTKKERNVYIKTLTLHRDISVLITWFHPNQHAQQSCIIHTQHGSACLSTSLALVTPHHRVLSRVCQSTTASLA